MKSLRILLLMVEPPLPFGNATARWYYVLLKGLVERGHQVEAFATCSNPKDISAARDLFPAPRYSLKCYEHAMEGYLKSKVSTFVRPSSYLFSSELKRDLKAAMAKPFDVLHLEMLWSGWLGLEQRAKALLKVYYLFEIDLSETKPPSFLDGVRLKRLFQAEQYLLKQYPWICTVSPRLTSRVREINPGAAVETVPVGMDLAQYPYREPACEKPVLTLIGSFNWMPTYSAGVRLIERLWPAIHKRVPQAELRVVGREARSSLGRLAEGRPEISIHENVPDTIPFFRDASAMLYAPSSGSGMKVKVLEAFALGLPVVTTVEGVEGISAIDGVHAGVSDDDAGLIDRTVALLQDRVAQCRQSRSARALVEQGGAAEPALDIQESFYARMIRG